MSAPVQWLWRNEYINYEYDRVLDYGCGRADDRPSSYCVDFNRYDPHFAPKMPKGKFDVVLCTYVLNTLPMSCEAKVLNAIRAKLKPTGTAFITVRRNLRREGYTSIGTYQGIVHLKLPIVRETSDYCIYRMPGKYLA